MPLIKKNAQGYGYNYTDLAQITKLIEAIGEDYYQEIETVDGVDHIVTVRLDSEGKEIRRIRGCRIVEAKLSGKENPVQAYGAALTYCRRYSLLMAYGLATTDDDAEGFTVKENKHAQAVAEVQENKMATDAQRKMIIDLCNADKVPQSFICEPYKITSFDKLTSAQAQAIINGWNTVKNSFKKKQDDLEGIPFK